MSAHSTWVLCFCHNLKQSARILTYRMTKKQAFRILRLCQQHELPKPQIKSSYIGSDYSVAFSMKDVRVRLEGFSAAWHFCRVMYLEQKERQLGVK